MRHMLGRRTQCVYIRLYIFWNTRLLECWDITGLLCVHSFLFIYLFRRSVQFHENLSVLKISSWITKILIYCSNLIISYLFHFASRKFVQSSQPFLYRIQMWHPWLEYTPMLAYEYVVQYMQKINLKVPQLWRHLPTPPSGRKFMGIHFHSNVAYIVYCKHVPTQSHAHSIFRLWMYWKTVSEHRIL